MNVELSWPSCDCFEEFSENIFFDSSGGSPFCGKRFDFAVVTDVVWRWFDFLSTEYFFIILFIDMPELTFQIFKILLSYYSSFKQLLRVEVIASGMFFDFLVNFGLSESGLILLIVTVSSVPYNINEDIFVEFLTVGDCNLHDFVENVRNICVYVNDWGINCFCNLCAVVWWTTLFRWRGEAYLIIVNNVNNSSWAVID